MTQTELRDLWNNLSRYADLMSDRNIAHNGVRLQKFVDDAGKLFHVTLVDGEVFGITVVELP